MRSSLVMCYRTSIGSLCSPTLTTISPLLPPSPKTLKTPTPHYQMRHLKNVGRQVQKAPNYSSEDNNAKDHPWATGAIPPYSNIVQRAKQERSDHLSNRVYTHNPCEERGRTCSTTIKVRRQRRHDYGETHTCEEDIEVEQRKIVVLTRLIDDHNCCCDVYIR